MTETHEFIEDSTDKNIRTIEFASDRITSLEELLERCKVDLNIWIVERCVVNTWEVGRKALTKDLTFTEGIINGEIHDDGKINVAPLYQVKATLIRRKPEAVLPVIQPIHLNLKYSKRPQRRQRLKAALIVSDTQIGYSRHISSGNLSPFHDERAMDLVGQIAEKIEPDTTIVIGDYLDWSGWSDKYIVQPQFYFTTQPALITGAKYLGRLKKYTRGSLKFIEGNHDLRPENQIIKHLISAYGLHSADNLQATPVMSIDNLLGLSRMGIDYISGYPDSEFWLNESTRIIHGCKVKSESGKTASAVVRDANDTTIFGHIHRRELATKTITHKNGFRTVTAFCPGCLCHVDGRVPGSKRSDQWQQGAAVIWYNDEYSSIVPLEVSRGRMIYEGQLYEGQLEILD